MKTGKKGFFSKLFASGNNDNISNKRVIAFLAFIILSALGMLSAFGHNTQTEVIYVFGALAGAQSLLTTIEKVNKGKKKIDENEENS